MKIRFDLRALKQTRGLGHVLRFATGGLVTVGTGLLAKALGPRIGGLFLALPAILPTGIALLVKVQSRQAGRGARVDRARRAAVIEATGASAAALGLVAFALVAWSRIGRWPSWLALGAATLAWAAVALALWLARKSVGPVLHGAAASAPEGRP